MVLALPMQSQMTMALQHGKPRSFRDKSAAKNNTQDRILSSFQKPGAENAGSTQPHQAPQDSHSQKYAINQRHDPQGCRTRSGESLSQVLFWLHRAAREIAVHLILVACASKIHLSSLLPLPFPSSSFSSAPPAADLRLATTRNPHPLLHRYRCRQYAN